jgi:hypothetical protein
MRERVASNFAVVRLSDEEMHALDALDRGEMARTVDLDWGLGDFLKLTTYSTLAIVRI